MNLRRYTTGLTVVAIAFLGVFGMSESAQAAEGNIALKDTCTKGWYVNGDEGALMPKQKVDGLLFDGKSLIKRAVGPFELSDTPINGSFEVKGDVVGVKPLMKMETLTPYSTINITPTGKFWSSRIAAGSDGGQDKPLDSLSDFLGKTTTHATGVNKYTDQTSVFSFGVGYANDTGNKALISTIKFNGQTFDMACPVPEIKKPVPSASTSPPATTPTTTPTTDETTVPPGGGGGDAGAGPTLPVTGPGLPITLVSAAVLIIGLGAVATYAARRPRKTKFTA